MFYLLEKLHTLTWITLVRGENKHQHTNPRSKRSGIFCQRNVLIFTFVYIYRKKLRGGWRSQLRCRNQTDISGLHGLPGKDCQSLTHFPRWPLSFHFPYPPPFKIKPWHREIWGGGAGKPQSEWNCKLPRTELSPNQEKGRGVQRRGQNKIVPTSESAHLCQLSFLLSLSLSFFLIWLLRTKEPQSSPDCIYPIWNVRMSMCFYVHNSNGNDSLHLWSGSHRKNRKGEGTGRPTAK